MLPVIVRITTAEYVNPLSNKWIPVRQWTIEPLSNSDLLPIGAVQPKLLAGSYRQGRQLLLAKTSRPFKGDIKR